MGRREGSTNAGGPWERLQVREGSAKAVNCRAKPSGCGSEEGADSAARRTLLDAADERLLERRSRGAEGKGALGYRQEGGEGRSRQEEGWRRDAHTLLFPTAPEAQRPKSKLLSPRARAQAVAGGLPLMQCVQVPVEFRVSLARWRLASALTGRGRAKMTGFKGPGPQPAAHTARSRRRTGPELLARRLAQKQAVTRSAAGRVQRTGEQRAVSSEQSSSLSALWPRSTTSTAPRRTAPRCSHAAARQHDAPWSRRAAAQLQSLFCTTAPFGEPGRFVRSLGVTEQPRAGKGAMELCSDGDGAGSSLELTGRFETQREPAAHRAKHGPRAESPVARRASHKARKLHTPIHAVPPGRWLGGVNRRPLGVQSNCASAAVSNRRPTHGLYLFRSTTALHRTALQPRIGVGGHTLAAVPVAACSPAAVHIDN
ncbi:uncharacterized protein BDR25DRAFT_378274 [Lindgomyces ingoldianus]|uniref:Uncharacterized protein n=1 Tax=Lindgomyces ingoldianus TaxID=673940 RepID=A0ACB6QGE8_9PLEO|nr:uncharacterized protein BDR25DRAFT_378274 [Lindgomyces ingoldianus]KAF2465999.1 hypothetical protein BDR25DRAFT_378274 [Lindgomyces ingoldianus]